MLAISYKPMKNNKNEDSQIGHTKKKKNIKKILRKQVFYNATRKLLFEVWCSRPTLALLQWGPQVSLSLRPLDYMAIQIICDTLGGGG